ncbi:MAG: ankyrin repeat domain-containing protein [Epsilonproteobacteria bacterium]|nr:ankyrin repeat domain-containing protein [Campylobacterota bacterium]
MTKHTATNKKRNSLLALSMCLLATSATQAGSGLAGAKNYGRELKGALNPLSTYKNRQGYNWKEQTQLYTAVTGAPLGLLASVSDANIAHVIADLNGLVNTAAAYANMDDRAREDWKKLPVAKFGSGLLDFADLVKRIDAMFGGKIFGAGSEPSNYGSRLDGRDDERVTIPKKELGLVLKLIDGVLLKLAGSTASLVGAHKTLHFQGQHAAIAYDLELLSKIFSRIIHSHNCPTWLAAWAVCAVANTALVVYHWAGGEWGLDESTSLIAKRALDNDNPAALRDLARRGVLNVSIHDHKDRTIKQNPLNYAVENRKHNATKFLLHATNIDNPLNLVQKAFANLDEDLLTRLLGEGVAIYRFDPDFETFKRGQEAEFKKAFDHYESLRNESNPTDAVKAEMTKHEAQLGIDPNQDWTAQRAELEARGQRMIALLQTIKEMQEWEKNIKLEDGTPLDTIDQVRLDAMANAALTDPKEKGRELEQALALKLAFGTIDPKITFRYTHPGNHYYTNNSLLDLIVDLRKHTDKDKAYAAHDLFHALCMKDIYFKQYLVHNSCINTLVQNDWTDWLGALLDAGFIGSKPIDLIPVLDEAIKHGSLETIMLLLERGAWVNFSQQNMSRLDNAQALTSDKKDAVVALLKEYGALTNAEIAQKTTSIKDAFDGTDKDAQIAALDAWYALTKQGIVDCDVLPDNATKRKTLDQAVQDKYVQVHAAVGVAVGDHDSLQEALKSKNLDMVKLVLHNSSINVNTAFTKFMPLHEAAKTGDQAIVEYLLSQGARASIPYKHQTAEAVARNAGHSDVADLLKARAEAELQQ